MKKVIDCLVKEVVILEQDKIRQEDQLDRMRLSIRSTEECIKKYQEVIDTYHNAIKILGEKSNA